jgi:hypothetical protein
VLQLHNAERVGAYHMPRDRLTDLKIVRQGWQKTDGGEFGRSINTRNFTQLRRT